MNKLFFMAGLFFLAAITFQFRHELSDSFDGLTDEAREARHRYNKKVYEMFADGKPWPNGDRYADSILLKKGPDQPVVYILYGATILFLFGGFMKGSSGKNISESA